MSESLSAEIEALYEVFGRVPRPVRVVGCSHCVEPDEDRPLLAAPLRSLDVDTFRRYATDALFLWGDVNDLRYFLPRLLELAAEGAFDWPDPEIVFHKLAYGEFLSWADEEREAVLAFLGRWWVIKLAEAEPWPAIEAVLCCLGRTGVDLAPFLSRWERLDSAAAVGNLHEFVMEGVTWRPSGPVLRNSFWEKETPGYRAVIAWLTDGSALSAVECAFDDATGEEVLALLDQTHTVLATHKAA